MSDSSVFKGTAVCPGIAFGHVHIIDRRRVTVPHYHVDEPNRAKEEDRLEAALVKSEEQLAALVSRADESGLAQVRALLEAHKMMLRDPALDAGAKKRIHEHGQNAEWAFKDTVRAIKEVFEQLEEDFFRERRSDVDIVGDRVLRNLVGAETELLNHLSDDAIVVAYDLSPADTVALAKFAALAFVTETGGRTSHTAILARALDVPCVLNAHGIMEVAGTGDELIVDGYAGEVVFSPSASTKKRYRSIEKRRRREEAALLADRGLPAETTDGVRVAMLGNIEVSQEIQPLIEKGGEGIGLYRTEFLYIEEPNLAGADRHAEAYRRVVKAVDGLEVTIRTFDEGGDKFLRASGSNDLDQADQSPLGLRAIRLSLRHEDLFREQLEGILRAAEYGPVRLLLPFITTVDEVLRARALIEEVKSSLPEPRSVPIGAMIETPAAALTVDLIIEHVDFLSVGTNDLMQYVLATDRGNDEVTYLYRPCQPAVIRTLDRIATAAKEAHKPVTVCGEVAADPFHTPLLLGLGFTSLSMTGGAIPLVKRMVRRLSAAECEAFVREVLKMPNAEAVEQELSARLRAWAPDLFS